MICSNGHQVRKLIQGGCSECWENRQATYKRRRLLGMELLRTAESRGMTGSEAIAVLQAVDSATIRAVVAR